MSSRQPLHGVIAAITTPFDHTGAVDKDLYLGHGTALLAEGCDGLNMMGTTGEATSLSVAERIELMRAVAASSLPMERLMVGTGAAAIADALTLTKTAAELGFAGALVLPPFYYKGVPEDGVIAYVSTVVDATCDSGIPIYLYNFPALSGVQYTLAIIEKLLVAHGPRVAGVKDSSNNADYCAAACALSDDFAVFPSDEGTLIKGKDAGFAGCISGTLNLNANYCAAAYGNGDSAALEEAVRIRAAFDGLPLVPAVKEVLARRSENRTWANVKPPLAGLSNGDIAVLEQRLAATVLGW